MLKDVVGKVPVGATADPERDADGEEERGSEVLGSTVLGGEVLEAWRAGCEVCFPLSLLCRFRVLVWGLGM